MRDARRLPSLRQRFAPAATVLMLAIAVVPVALAKVARNTIDPIASVSDNGRHLAGRTRSGV